MREKSFEGMNELIEAGLDEFAMKNYRNASLNKIIENASISKGTFYYYFKDKKALYMYLFKSAYGAEEEFINNRMKEFTEDNQKDIFYKFKLQFQIGGEFAAVYPKYYKFITMVLKEKGSEIDEDVKTSSEITGNIWLDQLIEQAIEHGDFNSRFNKVFIKKIMHYLFHNYFEIFNEEEDYELDKMLENADNFAEFLKYGLSNQRRI